MTSSRARPGNGGARVGAGRPKGSPDERSLTKLELRRIPEQKQPIYIMLKNMWWWDEQADNFAAQLTEDVAAIKLMSDDDAKIAALDKVKKKFDSFVHARDKAQDCARDAAPYCHAKLQSIQIKPDTGAEKIIEVETLVASSGDRNEEVEYRNGYDSSKVTPIRKAG